MKKSNIIRLLGISMLPISLFASTIIVAACANNNGSNNNDVNRPPGDVNIPKPPIDDDNNSSSKPPENNKPGSGTTHNRYGHNTPNPNYANDPANSFLISSAPSNTEDFTPSDGIVKGTPSHSGSLTNEGQVKNAKKSFAIQFGYGTMGTAWILDYKIPDGMTDSSSYTSQNYPLTWYFATNAHVLDNFYAENDPLYPTKNDFFNNYTDSISFLSLANPQVGTEYGTPNDNPQQWIRRYARLTADNQYPASATSRRVYFGNDFLKTSPKDFNASNRFKNMEEYADFAVLEVTFTQHSNPTYEDGALEVTNGYANLPQEEKFKYHKQDLLKNPQLLKDKNLHLVGFPEKRSPTSHFNTNRDVFVNRPEKPTEQQKLEGANLSTSPYYNTFDKHPGYMDGAIGMSGWFGYRYYGENDKEYATWGLIYPHNYGALNPGSSGSLLADGDGYVWGIHFASDSKAVTGLAQALYSEGYDYEGKYGKYSLPAYDLINGGSQFPLQKTSYRDNLIKLYGTNETPYRTNIFPNGINR